MHYRENAEKPLRMWTDNDWVGDVSPGRFCGRGDVQRGDGVGEVGGWVGGAICHWSQASVVPFSQEARLSSATPCLSGGMGVLDGARPSVRTLAIAKAWCSACGSWRVEHLSAEQFWLQGARQSYAMEVQKVPRAKKASDIMTHPIEELELKEVQ